MKRVYLLFTLILLSGLYGFSQTSLTNSGFENWYEYTGQSSKKYWMPNDWCGSNVHYKWKGIIPINVQTVYMETSGSIEGNKHIKVKTMPTMSGFPNSPGFFSPAQFWFDEKTEDAGFYMDRSPSFTGRPEAIKAKIKASPQSGDKTVVRIQMWNGTNCYNGLNNKFVNDANKIVDTRWESTAQISDWTEITIPLVYLKDGVIPEKINVIFSASDYDNSNTDFIKANSELSVDAVSFVYPSILEELKVGGTLVSGFNPNTFIYEIQLPDGTTTLPSITAKGKLGAIVSITEAGVNGATTIKVTAEDGSKSNTYTLNFKTYYKVTTSTTSGGNVTIENPSSDNRYLGNTILTLKATPNNGYKFDKWWNETTVNPYSYKVTSNATVSASFSEKIALSVNIDQSSLQQIYDGNAKNIRYTTVPSGVTGFNIEYKINGVVTSPVNVGTYNITISRAEDNLYKSFTADYTMKINKADIAVIELPVASPIEAGQPLSASTLTGGPTNKTGTWTWNTPTVIVNESGLYEVTFTPEDINNYNIKTGEKVNVTVVKYYTVQTGVSQNGKVEITGQTQDNRYAENSTITLRAVPNTGYKFDKWWNQTTTNPYSYKVTSNVTVTATFVPKQAITVNVDQSSLQQIYDGSVKNIKYTTVPENISGFNIEYKIDGSTTSPVNAGIYTVTMTRSEDNLYTAFSTEYTMKIEKADITIVTLPTATSIETGKPLSESRLVGGVASKTGTFSWTNPSLIITESGSYDITFTPDDNTNYNIKTGEKVNVAILKFYTVQSGTSENGTIQITGQTQDNRYVQGTSLTLQAVPATGYHFTKWWDNNTNNPRNYTVSADATLTAFFEKNSYSITATASVGGTITPLGVTNLEYGNNITYTITPNQGYNISEVVVDGVNVGTLQTYTFENITSNHTISAKFAISTFDITSTATLGGTVTPTNTTVNYGSRVIFTITPDNGYKITDFQIDGNSVLSQVSIDGLGQGTYTLSNITSNHNAIASFEIKTYTVQLPVITGVNISPEAGNDPLSVNYGSDFKFSIVAEPAYDHSTLVVKANNINITPENNIYTISTVTSNQIVSVTGVLKNRYSITNVKTEGGEILIDPSSADYEHGSIITLTAKPDQGYKFENWWTGATENPLTYEVNADISVSAQFAEKESFIVNVDQLSLTQTYDGTAKSIIYSTTPAGIICNVKYYQSANEVNPINAGIYDVVITRTEDDKYKEYTSSATLTIEGIQTVISVIPVASDLDEGQPLSESILTGGNASTEGTFVWENPTYTPNESGNHTVNFIPNDKNYKIANCQVNVTVIPATVFYDITLGASNNGKVSINGKFENGNFAENSIIILKAEPQEGYHFTQWWDGNTQNPRNFTVTNEIEISAKFEINTYIITLPSVEGATITVLEGYDPQSVIHGNDFIFTITLNPEYNASSPVVKSNGVLLSPSDNKYTMTAVKSDQSITVEAVTKNRYSVSLTQSTGGTITITPVSSSYEHGTVVTLEAVPNAGYKFIKWSNEQTSNPLSHTVTSNITLSAVFEAKNNIQINIDQNTLVQYYDNTPKSISFVTIPESIECNVIYTLNGENTTPKLPGIYNVVISRDEDQTYTSLYEETVLTIKKGNVTITELPVASDIIAGSLLSESILSSGQASVEGSFEWANPTEIPVITGTHEIVFIPLDNNYNNAVSQVNVIVKKVFSVIAGTTANGKIIINNPSSDNRYAEGTVITIEAIASEGYHFQQWWDGNTENPRSYTVNSDQIIAAIFEINKFEITIIDSENGIITPQGIVTAEYGSDIKFTITPNEGYHITDVLIDSQSVGIVNEYTFENVNANHTIEAHFAINIYNIISVAGTNGTITPSGTTEANYNESITYNMNPSEGYHVEDVLVDGISIGAVTNYTFENIKSNHTISVSFSINKYNMTSTAGLNGTITPSGTMEVNHRSSVTYTITPNEGYHIDELLIDGVSVEAIEEYTFTEVTSNHTINVTFAINKYNITIANTEHGTITQQTKTIVEHGSNVTFAITPDEGYHIVDVIIDQQSVGKPSTYTFENVTSDHEINALFAINTYKIISIASANGTITPSGVTEVNHGSSLNYTITPETGFQIEEVLVDQVSVGKITTYTFENITSDHTINVTFTINKYKITAEAGANGTITPAGITEVNYNGTVEYTITPNEGYKIENITVDGTNVNPTTSYVFENVTSDHTIKATFIQNTHIITAEQSVNGTITPEGQTSVNHGANKTYTITPNEGYHIADVMVDEQSIGVVESYTFENVISSHTISAIFEINTYTITSQASANGKITPLGATKVNYGDSQSYVVTPDVNYIVKSVLIDGNSITIEKEEKEGFTYVFNNITSDHMIFVEFEYNVGVEDLDNEIWGLKIYPNPVTSGRIYIDGEYDSLILIDLSGKIVLSSSDQTGIMETSGLTQGTYILRVVKQDKVKNEKIIIK